MYGNFQTCSFKPRLHYTQFTGTARLKLVIVPNFIRSQATNTKAEHGWIDFSRAVPSRANKLTEV